MAIGMRLKRKSQRIFGTDGPFLLTRTHAQIKRVREGEREREGGRESRERGREREMGARKRGGRKKNV